MQLQESGIAAEEAPQVQQELPEVLDYTGEFGPELSLFLPFCNYLAKTGALQRHRISTYRGMRCFYDDLGALEIIEKDVPREYIRPRLRPAWLPVRNEHDFDGHGRPAQHLYADLRGKFGQLPVEPEIDHRAKPLLVVHNKYNVEWRKGPVNYIDLATLSVIFRQLSAHFSIVYVRHGMGELDPDFSGDHNVPQDYADRPLLSHHPEILVFDDLFAAHRARGGTQDLNTFKNALYSRCFHFITSQGGGAAHIALFSGSLLSIMHRHGKEERWGYGPGYYGFMAAVPPVRAICRTDDDLVRSLALFESTDVVDGRVYLSSGRAGLLRELSPFTIAERVGPVPLVLQRKRAEKGLSSDLDTPI